MNSGELIAWDRAYQLRDVLPFRWYMAYMPGRVGIIIRKIDKKQYKPHDMIARTFDEIEDPADFQALIDEILNMRKEEGEE